MKKIIHGLRWFTFIVVALIINFPVIATLITSFKTHREIATNAGLWIKDFTFSNYMNVFAVTERLNIFSYLFNSLTAAAIGSILPIVLSFPIAYAIARNGYGRKIFFPLVVNLRTMPLIIFAIPIYLMYQSIGLLDTQLGLGLILAIVNLPLSILLIVNGINEIPVDLEEAARIDGAPTWKILLYILIPICSPVLTTTFVLGFITAWNEFLFGLMLTTTKAVPVTVGASFFFAAGGGGVQWGVAAAVILIAALPPVVLGMLMYRKIGQTMMAGAVKG